MKTKINDIGIDYIVQGSGKPIVLLHGLALDASIWSEVVRLYEDQAQFILPDLRGHGKSETGNANGSLEQFADDLKQLLDYLDFEQVSLVGHSMGGYISLAFAEKYPERLENLIMLTSNARADDDDKRKGRLADAEKVLQEGSRFLAEGMAPKLSKNPEIQQQCLDIVAATAPEGLSNVLRAIALRPERLDVIAGLEIPVFAIAGKDDQLMHPQVAFEMAQAAESGKAVVLPGVGHMPMLEAPLTLGALLISAL